MTNDIRKFNINEYVWVRLTERGRQIVLKEHASLRLCAPNFPEIPEILSDKHCTEDGFTKWQAWALMQTFGPYISMGAEPPFETDVLVELND